MSLRLADVLFWIGLALLATTGVFMMLGCSKDNPPPVLNPGSRAIYYNDGTQVYSVCDRGNLIYMQKKQFQVIPSGCPDGQP